MDPPQMQMAGPSKAKEAWPLRVLRLALGYFWALMLAATGAGIWMHRFDLMTLLPPADQQAALAAACLCLAGGQFIFLMLVAEDICPRTPIGLTVFLKTFTGSIIWMSIAWLLMVGWRVWM